MKTVQTFETQDEKRAYVREIMDQADILLSPMAGVSDRAFRGVCREMGADVTYCEFVSANGVLHGNPATFDIMEVGEEESPIGIQLFGSEPHILAEAARTAQKIGPDIIDLNFGCPVKKVVKRNGGSALLCNTPLMEDIVRAVVDAVSIPVTAKIRLGWSKGTVNYLETTKMLEEAGACAITIHGRTRDEAFRGIANWDPIAESVSNVSVPVIGNGDVWNWSDYAEIMDRTQCDAVMVARGSIGNPWIFEEVKSHLRGEEWQAPTLKQLFDKVVDHMHREVALKTERNGVKRMRRHFSSYFKGFSGAPALRQASYQEDTMAGVENVLQQFLREHNSNAQIKRLPSPRATQQPILT